MSINQKIYFILIQHFHYITKKKTKRFNLNNHGKRRKKRTLKILDFYDMLFI